MAERMSASNSLRPLAPQIDTAFAGAKDRRREADEQPMLDDAGDRVEPCRKGLRIGNCAKGAIEDQMAAVGDEGRADFFASVIAPASPNSRAAASTCNRVAFAPKRSISTGSGKAPSV